MAKVLLADDSVTIQKVVEIVLKEKGFEVRAVNTGEDALIALDSYTPDIVLADIQMPGISGYQLTEQIRQHPQTRDLPVILLAGAFEPLDLPLAKKVGANKHLIKPFESKDLINMINELLSAKKPAPVSPALLQKTDSEELMDIDFSDIMSDLNSPEVATTAQADEEAIEVMAFEDESDDTAVMASDLQEAIAEPAPLIETFTPKPAAPVAPTAQDVTHTMPATQSAAFSAVDMEGILRNAIEEKLGALDLASALSSAIEGRLKGIIGPDEVRAAIREAIAPSINDSIEKILWEIMPDMIEAMLREAIKETVVSLKQELENVVWDTVPDIAENIIRQEIDSIRSGN